MSLVQTHVYHYQRKCHEEKGISKVRLNKGLIEEKVEVWTWVEIYAPVEKTICEDGPNTKEKEKEVIGVGWSKDFDIG